MDEADIVQVLNRVKDINHDSRRVLQETFVFQNSEFDFF